MKALENALGNLPNQHKRADVSQGVWTLPKAPWLSICDTRVTDAASKGIYLVYLFKDDFSGMYLSLNQGTKYLASHGIKTKEQADEIDERLREELAGHLNDIKTDDLNQTIRLHENRESTNRQKKYEDANVYALYYSKEEILGFHDDEQLERDLGTFLGLYDVLLEKIGVTNDMAKDEGFHCYEEFIAPYVPHGTDIPFEETTPSLSQTDFKRLIKEAACMVDGNGHVVREPRNLIFHGAPGTGKTYNVLRACAELINGGPVDGEPLKWLNENADGRFSMVQFHPSYDYTDFVEGLRPHTTDDGNVGFELMPGEFMSLCGRARAAATQAALDSKPAPQYYMLIDEINRGDISKIFGELFFLLDPGYRGQGVSTQYANMHDPKWRTPTTEPGDGGRRVQYLDADGGFSIPENVTIVGTMNDIDRSVDSLDFAMRRRFSFVDVTAGDSWGLMIGKDADAYPSADRARERMDSINAAIEKTPELGPDYTLGATYFRSLARAGEDGFESEWSETWSDRIEPLLREYLRGTGLDADTFDRAIQDRTNTEGTMTAHGDGSERILDFGGLIEAAACKRDGSGAVVREPRNLIFHGAPGTGKTYNVLRACAELINGGPVDGEPLKWLNENADGRFSMVQFHPSYDYTDFVEGLRPHTTDDGNVGFELMPGEFMSLCGRARAAATQAALDSKPAPQYYMLIDEINRGDISKIFGELFFLLDPGYRGQGVSTQYANMHDPKWRTPTTEPGDGGRRVQYLDADGGFSIPENVTIVGTMNDIDRSVDSLDFAMRRRFSFVDVTAGDSWGLMIGKDADAYPSADRARERMDSINAAIEKTPELGPDYTLGATYFRSLARAGEDGFESEWSETWSDRIEPLLREYLRGTGLDADTFDKWGRKPAEDTDTGHAPGSERKGDE